MAHWLSMISPLNVFPFGAAKLRLDSRTVANANNRERFTGLPPRVWFWARTGNSSPLSTMRDDAEGYRLAGIQAASDLQSSVTSCDRGNPVGHWKTHVFPAYFLLDSRVN